jgi:hypothetical protein
MRNFCTKKTEQTQEFIHRQFGPVVSIEHPPFSLYENRNGIVGDSMYEDVLEYTMLFYPLEQQDHHPFLPESVSKKRMNGSYEAEGS